VHVLTDESSRRGTGTGIGRGSTRSGRRHVVKLAGTGPGIGWILLVLAGPVAGAVFYQAPGEHLGASVALGCGCAAAIDLLALTVLWPGSTARQRGWAVGCAVSALAVPLLILVTVVLMLGLAGS
jgi:hypothetical protein